MRRYCFLRRTKTVSEAMIFELFYEKMGEVGRGRERRRLDKRIMYVRTPDLKENDLKFSRVGVW